MNIKELEQSISNGMKLLDHPMLQVDRVVGNSGGGDLSALERQAFGGMTNESVQHTTPMNNTANYNERLKTAKLPKAILESFQETPPIEYHDPELMPVLDRTQIMERIENKINQNQQMQQTVPQSAPSNIDYALIKTIVKECIRESQTLQEGQVQGLRIGKGNVIQFVDNKGNIYEGKLTLKKRKQ